MIYSIYGLIETHTFQLRYIGVTNNYKRRESEHRRGKQASGKYYYTKWRSSLTEPPIMVLLDTASDRDEASKVEQAWIEKARVAGVRLVNQKHGGYESRYFEKLPPEWRKAISVARTGMKLNLSEAQRQRKAEVAVNLHTGLKRSPETRKRQSEVQKILAVKRPPERRYHLAAWAHAHKGVPRSLWGKVGISMAQALTQYLSESR